jgi:hypothetical protein
MLPDTTNNITPINSSNLIIPNGDINIHLNFNDNNNNTELTIQWDKPKENSSYITGYQLKNYDNILQSFSSTSNIATVNLTNNTTYSLTLVTLYEGGSIVNGLWKFTTKFPPKNDSNISTSVPTSMPKEHEATILPTGLPMIGTACLSGECGFVKEVKTRDYPSIYSIFHSILALFAIYLSFKCNKGFSFGSFFMAIFFPYIYIIYKYATTGSFCNIDEIDESDE